MGYSRAFLQHLASVQRRNRRETIYQMLSKMHMGKVPCFVCGKHVRKEDATLEHILAKSKGGTDDMDNLSISHAMCNVKRGNGD
jgi:5-methylcytosine-specific restriction endonuclease McrA